MDKSGEFGLLLLFVGSYSLLGSIQIATSEMAVNTEGFTYD